MILNILVCLIVGGVIGYVGGSVYNEYLYNKQKISIAKIAPKLN